MKSFSIQLADDICVLSLVGNATSHLVVSGGRSLLVDCHSWQMVRWLDQRGLPAPDLILHTHVQPEHCREAAQFPGARIMVHEQLVELASDPEAWQSEAKTVWENPAEWPVTLGREKYGVAGCITVFPPDIPLNVGGTFREGDRIQWQGLVFVALSLPGHGRHHCGFTLELDGLPLAVFTGDLLCDGAKLPNIYDLEVCYGGTDLPVLPGVLRDLARQSARRYFPSTGHPIEDGPSQACALADSIDAYQQSLSWRSGSFEPALQSDASAVGRYRRHHPGIYQIGNFGNCILLIDAQGHGLMFDPGPCDFEAPDRVAAFHRDLDLFEAECGLVTIDAALVTHIHGDHYDMVPELRKRYRGCRVGAWDLVARVMEAPWDYPYPALLPYYNLGFDYVPVDDVLTEDEPYRWRDTTIESVHLPGHCHCHAGYLLTFNGLRVAITGDTIQNRGDSATVDFIIANQCVPDEAMGNLKAYRTLLAAGGIDLNLGGHGSHFHDCDALYAESVRRIEHALPFLRRLVPRGDLHAAFSRPNLPRWPGF